MRLEINEINHQHIVKIVVFALFLFKSQIKSHSLYRLSVLKFIKSRIPWKIDLVIKTEERLDKDRERELILTELLIVMLLIVVTLLIVTPVIWSKSLPTIVSIVPLIPVNGENVFIVGGGQVTVTLVVFKLFGELVIPLFVFSIDFI